MRGQLSSRTKLFQIEFQLVLLISFDSKFYTLILPKIYRFSIFSFRKNYSIFLKGQSEYSELCPDIRAVLFSIEAVMVTDFAKFFRHVQHSVQGHRRG